MSRPAGHSFSANIQTKKPESEVVQDADRMEALGAIGLDDKKFAIDHFHEKLLKLPSTMKTQKRKAEAEKRASILTRFLEDLRAELTT